MINRILIGVLSITIIGSVTWMASQRNNSELSRSSQSQYASNNISVELYKSAYCGCCEKWGDHMKKEGFEVSTIVEEDMSKIKDRLGVPYELESCHTSVIDGYVVEGHIPNEAIEKLLDERPDIKGIGMAGMPSGSPGMPGPKEDFLVYEINHDGTKGDLFMEL